jgi:NADPH-dependent 2,4-dienoyl-CoA reductase/sulfur reductase-like enzyme
LVGTRRDRWLIVRLVIVGGSDAGIVAGLRARQADPTLDVVVVDAYPTFSICGLPYWISRDVRDWHELAHRTSADLRAAGLDLRLGTRADPLDPDERVLYGTTDGQTSTMTYDRLIVATGAEPIVPRLPGIDLPGVHPLHHMADAFALDAELAERDARSALIVGAGYIGLEMAEALQTRGLSVTVVERLREVLPTVDAPLGARVREILSAQGTQVHTATAVTAIEACDGALRVATDTGVEHSVDVALVSVGVRPSASLGIAAGADASARAAFASMRAWRPRSMASGLRATASTRTTACCPSRSTCHSARPLTSRAGSRARMPQAATGGSPVRWGPRW